MIHFKGFGDLIGDRAVAEEIEKIEIDRFGLPDPFQPAFDEGAGGASGAVFENDLWAAAGTFPNLLELIFLL